MSADPLSIDWLLTRRSPYGETPTDALHEVSSHLQHLTSRYAQLVAATRHQLDTDVDAALDDIEAASYAEARLDWLADLLTDLQQVVD